MIYLIKTEYKTTTLLKIGYAECVEDRIKTYKTHNPLVELLDTREGGFDLETYLHKYFKEFACPNQPEWFYYNEKIIKEFKYVEDRPFIEDVTSKVKSVFFTAPSFSKFREKYIEKYGKDEFNKCDNFIFNYWLDYSRRMNGIELEASGGFEQITWDSKIHVSNLPFNTPDIEIEISALFGRQRNKSNQFKNNVTIFYKLLKNENLEDKSQFDKLQINKKEKTDRLINIYNKITEIEKSDYSGKIRSSIEVENYCEDFAGVSRKTGKVIYNNLIEVANERSWVIAQKDYQDSINVTRAISSLGYETDNSRDKLEKEIFNQFKLGDVLPKQSIKDKLRQIYLSLGIESNPKATDLGQYFNLKAIKVKDSSGKWVHGFEIIRRK